ncbi:hypothetical protein [Mammaliicoccus sciuri]|uniref:hypothetical protein n=1 Tax=Mammaliicoccus sciuri TaxID=1296 RepID=UPI0034DD39D6
MIKYHTQESLEKLQDVIDNFVNEKGTGITKNIDEKSIILIGSDMKTVNEESRFSFVTLNVQTLELDKEIKSSKDWITEKKPFKSVEDLEEYLNETTYEELIWFKAL